MKKFILSLFIAICAVFSMSAGNDQLNYVGHSRFFDNTSIGLYGGIQTNLHEWNDPNGAVSGLWLNKEITPTFGLTIDAGTTWNNSRDWVSPRIKTAVDHVYVMLAGRTNLFNLFGGYAVRPFDIETVAGIGYGHAFGDLDQNMLLVKGGLNFNYNFGTDKEWTVTVQPAVVWNTHRVPAWTSYAAVGQLTAGVTYRFKTSNGTHHFAVPVLYDNDEVNALRAALAEKPTEVIVEKEIVRTVEVLNTEIVNILPKVQFLKASANVEPTCMANLKDIADIMKETGLDYTITGYASEEGTLEFNEKLSGERANAVRDILVDFGVNPDNLTTVAGGPVDIFGTELTYNRVVTIDPTH